MKLLPSFLVRLSVCAMLLGGSGLTGLAQSPTRAAELIPSEAVGPLILRDESIDQVLVLLERWTGKTVLRPQALPASTITISLKGSVTREEAIRALETLLALNGVAISPLDDKFLKVTALAAAKSEAPELIDGSTLSLPPSGRVASKVFQLHFLRVTEFMPQIAALLNPGAGSPPVIFEKANAALVVDSVTNLQRIETLINRLDQPLLSGMEPKFYPLHFAKASDVVNKMRTILSGPLQSQLGSATTYNADDRTNQIILVSDPRQIAFFDELIAKLDVKSDPNTRNEVIYLKFAAAKDVASILSQLVSGQNSAAKASGNEPVNRPGPPAAAPGAANPAPASAMLTPAALGLGTEVSNQFSAILTILPEERSNAIVVAGTADDIRLVRQLVDHIDILLAQVRIEIVVAEVTLGDQATSGIDSLGLQVSNGRLVGINGAGSGTTVGGAGTGSFFALAGANSLAGLVSVATTPRKSRSTILSQPTITTTHNKEAEIFVGQTLPTITGTTSSNASVGAATPFTTSTITQREVGITIKVKPLIGNDGSVQLDLKQEISDVGAPVTIDGNTQNIILKRTTSQFITAHSGEILVLGGLQKRSDTHSTNRLGPLPLLGDLLGTRKRDTERTELVFFLRPTVLTNTPADNSAALQQVENFPPPQREQVKQALAPGSRP